MQFLGEDLASKALWFGYMTSKLLHAFANTLLSSEYFSERQKFAYRKFAIFFFLFFFIL
jgi:hypothetical protein